MLEDDDILRNAATPQRAAINTEAADLVTGDRNRDYGDPVENHEHIAAIYNAWQKANLTALDICRVLTCVKLARVTTTPQHRDSYVDRCGYAGIEYEIAVAEQEKNIFKFDGYDRTWTHEAEEALTALEASVNSAIENRNKAVWGGYEATAEITNRLEKTDEHSAFSDEELVWRHRMGSVRLALEDGDNPIGEALELISEWVDTEGSEKTDDNLIPDESPPSEAEYNERMRRIRRALDNDDIPEAGRLINEWLYGDGVKHP